MTPHQPATLWERRYGIPTRETGQRDHDSDPARHADARREAAALRSRAFARRGAEYDARLREGYDPATWQPLRTCFHAIEGAWLGELREGCPGW